MEVWNLIVVDVVRHAVAVLVDDPARVIGHVADLGPDRAPGSDSRRVLVGPQVGAGPYGDGDYLDTGFACTVEWRRIERRPSATVGVHGMVHKG